MTKKDDINKNTDKELVAANESENAVAVVSPEDQFMIMTMQPNELQELLDINMTGEELKPSDMPVIKVPSGGATSWTVPSINGEVVLQELDGIIPFTQLTRGYWPTSFDDGEPGPPECWSEDGQYGLGEHAQTLVEGKCCNCEYQKFGSGKNGGQACQQKRLIYFILKDEVLPVVVRAPAMSLKNVRAYLSGLMSRRKPIHSVYTRLTLVADKNKKGKQYAKIVCAMIGEVENPQVTEAYARSLKPLFMRVAAESAKTQFGYDD